MARSSRAPFGVWVDIAALHPALLLVPEMAGARERRIEFEDYPALGIVLEAWIVLLGDGAEIALSQNPQAAELAQRQVEPNAATDGGA
ncbi:MAG: hypothetical protein ACJ8C4_09285 [Gemmataceae bacterium]